MTTFVLAVLVAIVTGILFYLADCAKDLPTEEKVAACTEEDYELADKIAAKL